MQIPNTFFVSISARVFAGKDSICGSLKEMRYWSEHFELSNSVLRGPWNSGTTTSGPLELAHWNTKETRSTFLGKGTRYCLIHVSSLQRELSTFSDGNFVLARSPPFRFAGVLSLVDIKADGRKREESSYRCRVREWKRKREKKYVLERRISGSETWTWKFMFDDGRLFVRSLLSSDTFRQVLQTMQFDSSFASGRAKVLARMSPSFGTDKWKIRLELCSADRSLYKNIKIMIEK